MARLVLAIIALVLTLAVIKLAIIALIVAGLIFRPTITIGLLVLLGLLALIRHQPAVGLGAIAMLIVAAVAAKKRGAC